MNYYTDKQYSGNLSSNAKKDLSILFFDSFLKDSKKILDIGCSVGRIISLSPSKIEGVDIDKKALQIAKSRGCKVQYANISEKLPFKDESFDAIFLSQVIEHLENPLFAMQEIKRVLKKNGKLVAITIDYKMTHYKEKNGFWSDYTHKTPFIKESLKRVSYDAGLAKFRVYHFPGFGFRHLMRLGLLSKESWIKLEKFPFIWRGQDLILEAIKN